MADSITFDGVTYFVASPAVIARRFTDWLIERAVTIIRGMEPTLSPEAYKAESEALHAEFKANRYAWGGDVSSTVLGSPAGMLQLVAATLGCSADVAERLMSERGDDIARIFDADLARLLISAK